SVGRCLHRRAEVLLISRLNSSRDEQIIGSKVVEHSISCAVMEENRPERIVFFDGICGLCNSWVSRMIRWDHRRVLHYAPLQGSVAADLLESVSGIPDSVAYWRGGQLYFSSTAVIEAMADMGGGWRAMRAAYLFPRFFRDAVYRLVARNRYDWFGKRERCRIPSPAERNLFLD
ncbi:MAG: thiol-disulfide oxidoreductase DCC family protein, partial [Bacteroidota bacterium]